jgi:hypothetical protein
MREIGASATKLFAVTPTDYHTQMIIPVTIGRSPKNLIVQVIAKFDFQVFHGK